MTHTYSRGCFKLIFRKCLSHTSLLLPCKHTYILYRNCPPSRAFAHRRMILLNTSIITLLLLFSVFPEFGCFFFLFIFYCSYLFSSSSSAFFHAFLIFRACIFLFVLFLTLFLFLFNTFSYVSFSFSSFF